MIRYAGEVRVLCGLQCLAEEGQLVPIGAHALRTRALHRQQLLRPTPVE